MALDAKLLATMRSKNYQQVPALLESYEDSVNVYEDELGLSLLQNLIQISKPNDPKQELINFVINHDKFKIDYKSKDGESNLQSILRLGRYDLLSTLLQKPKFKAYILTDENFQYIRQHLETARKTLAGKATTWAQDKVNNLEQTLAVFTTAKSAQALGKTTQTLLSSMEALKALEKQQEQKTSDHKTTKESKKEESAYNAGGIASKIIQRLGL